MKKTIFFITNRIILAIVTLLGFSLIIFLVARVVPGDPARMALGELATEEQLEKFRHEMGLDKPLYVQYVTFLKKLLLESKVGMSVMTYHEALIDVLYYFPATLELVGVAMFIAIVIGLPLGVSAAVGRNKLTDSLSRIIGVSGVSVPRFWIGILLQLSFAYLLGLVPVVGRIETGVSPPSSITGLFLIDSLLTFNIPALVSSFKCLLLPAFTLCLSPIALIMKTIRSSMIQELGENYSIVFEANGMPPSILTYKYMLRKAILPTLSVFGLCFVFLIGNAFVVETVFAWPGIASYTVTAVFSTDINVIIGVSLLLCILYLLVNNSVDVICYYLDPRIKKR